MEDCGYKFVPAEQRIKEYECSICSHLLREAIELPCHHMNCQSCIWGWQQSPNAIAPTNDESGEEKYKCPACKSSYSIEQTRQSASTDRIITNALKVKCIWHTYGCSWNGTIPEYHTSHKATCEFSIVHCPFDGCQTLVHRTEIETHEESCAHRYSECKVCNVHVDWKADKNHKCMISCPNSQCSEKLEKEKLSGHVQDCCSFTMIDCKYIKYGCYEQFPRNKMEAHAKRCDCTELDIVKAEISANEEKSLRESLRNHRINLPKLKEEEERLAKEYEELRREWDQRADSKSFVITESGEGKIVTAEDVKVLILENDFKTFMHYICTCESLVKLKDEQGESLLQYAARQNCPKFVLWLLEYESSLQIDPKIKTGDGLNIAQIAVNIDSLKMLVVVLNFEPGFMLPEVTSPSLLHQAVAKGSVEIVEYLCSRLDADVNLKNEDGKKADELEGVSKEIKKLIKNRR